MQTHKANITVESFASLTVDGVEHGIFIADADTPIQSSIDWKTMIDELFEMYTVPSRNVPTLDSFGELVEHLNSMQNAAAYFKEKLLSTKVFDRDAWLSANNGEFNQTNFEDFYKDSQL